MSKERYKRGRGSQEDLKLLPSSLDISNYDVKHITFENKLRQSLVFKLLFLNISTMTPRKQERELLIFN